MSPTELIRALDSAIDARRAARRRGTAAPRPAPPGAHAAATDQASPKALPPEMEGLLALGEAIEAGGPGAAPSPEFRARLALQLADAPAPRGFPAPRTAPPILRWLIPGRRSALAGAMAAAAGVFLLVGAVRASAAALPGQPLYPVKRSVERARLLLAGDNSMALHLEMASHRLDEAAAVPASAGTLLAEFTREVTSALADADRALAYGTPRERVAKPLLTWLLDARVRLIATRGTMPPMAWRGALALVDEAISALADGGPLSTRPVPRLEDPARVLARWEKAGMPWDRPLGGPLLAARRPGGPEAGAPKGPVPDSPPRAGAPVSAVKAAPPGPPAAVPTTAPTLPPPPPPGPPPKEPKPPAPQPTATPLRLPTATPPAEPTGPAATATSPTATSPTAAPIDPTPSPTPSSTPTNRPPVIVAAWCQPNPVRVYTYATCTVDVDDPDDPGDELTYEWSAEAGRMLNNTAPVAVYYASFSFGMKETTTWITIHVEDPAGAGAEERFPIRVISAEEQGDTPGGPGPGRRAEALVPRAASRAPHR